MAALQSGTAFFASTSLLAIGGALTILRSPDEMLDVRRDATDRHAPTARAGWEMKAIGLAVIFVYAFFKFAWSYRLYNYVAILLGAMPPSKRTRTRRKRRCTCSVRRACCDGGGPALQLMASARSSLRSAFSAGSSAPTCSMATTAAVVFVMWWRQFASDARRAMAALTRRAAS